MDDGLKLLFPEFLQEAYDILANVQATLKQFAVVAEKDQLLESIFRGVHTIKGGCGMFELHEVKEVAHKLENDLGGFRGKVEGLTPDVIVTVQKTIDKIEDLLKEGEAKFHGQSPSQPKSVSVLTQAVPAAQITAKESLSSTTTAPSSVSATAPVDVLRVPLPHVTNALNNIWEVFLIRNQLEYLFEQEKSYLKSRIEFLQSWELLDSALKRNISELESTLMAMRMSSVKSLFSRMEKVVRSYLDSTPEKNIVFETAGETTELDKKVIDMLGEPLIHLVRNAMDHGIETKENRIAAGKAGDGRIILSAEAMADRVLVRIKDDGKGIDGAKLIEKAEAKGLDVSAFKTGSVSPVDIIFMPGFSTAEKVTDVSGRGVGMDAVRDSIGELGGRIEIDTIVGQGSTFSIYLPLSLSVIPATVFRVNSGVYGANVGTVIEVCRIMPKELQMSNGNLYYFFRGKYILCFDLTTVISKDKYMLEEPDVSLFVVKYKRELVALRISDVNENTEVVVKPVPSLLPRYSFVQGMSILPTGKAIFILSFDALIDAISAKRGRPKELNKRELENAAH